MKISDHEIRDAMNKRLSFLHENSGRRARIRGKIADEQGGGAKQKATAWVALTAVTALIIAGVALSVGLNAFGLFSNRDARTGEPAAQEALCTQPVFAAGEDAAEATAEITNTYYDGKSLIVEYAIQNAIWWGAFTPTGEQLSDMILSIGPVPIALHNDPDDPLVRQYLDALDTGTACGLIFYSALADDHTSCGFGVELSAADELYGEYKGGTQFAMRKYTGPLPDREYLNVDIELWKNTVYLYFDGTDTYMMNAQPESIGAMSATALRAEGTQTAADAPVKTRHMTGTGTLLPGETVFVYAEADVSAARGTITLRAHGEGFTDPNAEYAELIAELNASDGVVPELIGDYWYELTVCGSDRKLLPMGNTYQPDSHTLTAAFQGDGSLPEMLLVSVLITNRATGTNVTELFILIPAAEPAYAGSWEELNAAAQAEATNVIITADITYGEGDDTVVFSNAVKLQSAEGEHYTIDGNGRQILCVQGADKNMPLEEETLIRNLCFQNGNTSDKSMDVYNEGYGSAVFVQGPLMMESCVFQYNEGCGGALCVDGNATLMDCMFTDNEGRYGGGLYIDKSDVFIGNCTFAGNRALLGGGAYLGYGNATIIKSVFTNNSAEIDGGGLYFISVTAALENCTLCGNTAAQHGGAVIADNGSVTLEEQTELSENQATYGGGVYANRTSVVLDNAGIIANTASSGGGICLEGGSIVINAGMISENTADTGAGIYASGSEVSFTGGTITENNAAISGGGIYLESSTYTQEAGTVCENSPDDVAQP